LEFQTYLKHFLHHQKWVKWKLMGIVLGFFPLRYDTGKKCICIGYSGKHKTKASTWQIKSASAFKQPAVKLFTTSGCLSKFSMYLLPLFHKKSSMLGLGNWYIFLCFLLSEAHNSQAIGVKLLHQDLPLWLTKQVPSFVILLKHMGIHPEWASFPDFEPCRH
jgi:hypothetical protein